MKVILTEKVPALGNVGEILNVSAGYGRNYLIPNKFAVLADEGNKKQIAHYQKQLAKKVSEQKASAESAAAKMSNITLTLVKKVGASGRLFGTVTNTELAKELGKKGIDVERRLIVIETPIKSIGSYEVKAKLFKDVEATFKVNVEIDPKQAEEMKKKQELAEQKAAEKKAKADAGETEEVVAEETEVKELTDDEKLKIEADKLLRS